ncbi:hypothetical protein ACHAXR_003797, partial [Thalassiosira sp. AJA248-18]
MLAISTVGGGMTLLLHHHHNHRSNGNNNDDSSNRKTMDHYHTGAKRSGVRRRGERDLNNNNLNDEEIITNFNWMNTPFIPIPTVHTDPTPDVWTTTTTTTTTTTPDDFLADVTTTELPMIVTMPTPTIESDVSTTTTTSEEFLAGDPSTTTTAATEPIDMPKYWWPIEPIKSGELPICVYSNHYPDYYNHESYRHLTLFDAYEECCTAYESCGATTTTAAPPASTITTPLLDNDKEYWYPQISPDGIPRCIYNANYPAEYITISEGIQNTILFESQLDCCAAYPFACVDFFWYPPPPPHGNGGSDGANSSTIEYCFHGNDYPVEWTGDEDYLFLSQGRCCDRWCGAGGDVFGDDGAGLATVATGATASIAATTTKTTTSPEAETATTTLETTSSTTIGDASTTVTPESTMATTAAYHPTYFPSMSLVPSLAPTKQFLVGDLAITHNELGIRMSSGLSVKLIATTGMKTRYANGMESIQHFHGMMDGAGIVPLPDDGGYVYVSNSEISRKEGGVYGLYFNKNGDVVDYKTLLNNTSRNCGGGLSPWNTWISCEEVNGGQCWQVDPNPLGANHENPMETLLGGVDGGRYETVACDNRNPLRPIFFTTEDHKFGALRRFEANGNGWDALHRNGQTLFLRIIDGSNYEWTNDEIAARNSAATYYRNAEGITYHEGILYFTAKKTKTLFILDLQNMTYESEVTGGQFVGKGSFNAQPDQIFLGNYK